MSLQDLPRVLKRNLLFQPTLLPIAFNCGVPTQSRFTFTTIMHDRKPYDLRSTYTRFRILVIGRANAGKTTLLKRVCNTTEDPCIYDENNKNLVSLHRPENESCC